MVGDRGNLQHGMDPRLGRRRLLTAGAAALPVIITLRARPAMAQINLNYSNVEYRYGLHAGKTSEEVQEERDGPGLPPAGSPGFGAGQGAGFGDGPGLNFNSGLGSPPGWGNAPGLDGGGPPGWDGRGD